MLYQKHYKMKHKLQIQDLAVLSSGEEDFEIKDTRGWRDIKDKLSNITKLANSFKIKS